MDRCIRYVLVWLVIVILPCSAQQADWDDKEQHVPMPIEVCSADGCISEKTSLTLDAEWRFAHDKGYGSCGGLFAWNSTLCPDEDSCAKNCALDGVNAKVYKSAYGIHNTPSGVQLDYVTGSNIGSRVYLMDETGENYRLFKLKNKEIAFDVDVSTLECGMNAATYFIEMPQDGGKGQGNNAAGAKYGTGYCDARCPRVKFMDGKANIDGSRGSCCAELDLFEANRMSGALTVHPCSIERSHTCQGIECGDGDQHQYYLGVCDKDGCEFNPYRLGNHSFMGDGATVNLKKPVTVVTQFHTEDGTDSGALSEIRIIYRQDGRVIQNSRSMLNGIDGDSITDGYCDQVKEQYVATRDVGNSEGAYNQFREKGGLRKMGEALDRGMVLALSIWDDEATKMQWLDSFLPNDLPEGTPGALRGPCEIEWGTPAWMRENMPDMHAKMENFQFGDIGSTGKNHKKSKSTGEVNKSGGKKHKTKTGKTSKVDMADTEEDYEVTDAQIRQPAPGLVAGIILGSMTSMLLLAVILFRRQTAGQPLLNSDISCVE